MGSQPYDYVIVVDFDTTESPEVPREKQEIISWPWLVYAVSDNQVQTSQQFYIKPHWTPQLPESVSKATGITEELLASSSLGSLQEAVQQFDNFCFTQLLANNKSFCLISDGPVDIKYILRSEATRKGVKLAAHYSKFLDVRREFKKRHPSKPAGDLETVATSLGIPIEAGTRLRGAVGCNTIARVLSRLLADGHVFANPETIPDSYDPAKDPEAQRYFNPPSEEERAAEEKKEERERDGEEHGERDGAREGGRRDSGSSGPHIVRLRGLPWQANEEDIRRFLEGITIPRDAVVIVQNSSGRPTGEAFVKFPREEEAEKAMERHRQQMGHRYVEVFRATEKELEETRRQDYSGYGGFSDAAPTPNNQLALTGYPSLDMVSSTNPDVRYQGVLRMRGLPYSATKYDIEAFFSGFPLVDNGVHICVGSDGRPTGEAYVEFGNETAALDALSRRQKERIGSRYIELFRSTKGDLYNYVASRNQAASGAPLSGFSSLYGPGGVSPSATPSAKGAPTGGIFSENTCVRLRGLPFSATSRDIMEFFIPVGATPITVHIVNNAGGRPTGEAYAEFASADEAMRGMQRHKANIGHRYVEVFRATRTEMATQMAMAAYSGAPVQPDTSLLMGAAAMGGALAGMPSMGSPMGSAMGSALTNPLLGMGGMGGMGAASMAGNNQLALISGSLGGLGMPGLGGFGGMPGLDMGLGGMSNPLAGGFGRPMLGAASGGAVVRMRGLPYRAASHDIVDFFQGCEGFIPSSVQLGTDHDGRSSGEAWVCFGTMEQAARAVRDRNRAHMGGRYIELFLGA
eukprot:tig00000229_g20107.t1